jgi:hypothetical protein
MMEILRKGACDELKALRRRWYVYQELMVKCCDIRDRVYEDSSFIPSKMKN